VDLEQSRRLVRRFVEAINERDEAAVAELASAELALRARAWVRPFDSAFPDFRMEIAELVAEGKTVVAHLRCSGTHEGDWLGVPPTGRRFADVDEVYVFRLAEGRIVEAFGVEDNLARVRQLGLTVAAGRSAAS
jgi:predicted ester cyclase